MWAIIPKISITIYITSLFIISLWYSIEVVSKRTFWFSFLKITDAFGVLFLLELTSRWYFALRADGEPIITSIVVGMIATLCSLLVIGIACGAGVAMYLGLRRLYNFSLSRPVGKIKARTRKWLDENWKLADDIAKRGLLKAFKDYWGF